MRETGPRERHVGMCNTTRDTVESSPHRATTDGAFTVVDLVVVIAILSLMAMTIIISLSAIA